AAKQGIDDYIARHGGEAAQGLMDAAVPHQQWRRTFEGSERGRAGRSEPSAMKAAAATSATQGPDQGRGHSDRPTLWPEPVGGADLFGHLVAFFEKYLVLRAGTALVLTLWAIATW